MTTKLTVSIHSFSYKKTLPEDQNGNGGGFVFDCRSINNPGRNADFKNLTGMDKEVIDFLNNENTVHEFMENVFALVKISVTNYMERGFGHLMVNFGCTGGQHRSVYCAEHLAMLLRKHYNISIIIHHRELQQKRAV